MVNHASEHQCRGHDPEQPRRRALTRARIGRRFRARPQSARNDSHFDQTQTTTMLTSSHHYSKLCRAYPRPHVRTADIDRGDLAGARGALDVPDDRDFASSGLDITIYAIHSDHESPTTPNGANFGGPFDRRLDGSRSRAARTSPPRAEARKQCSYVLHSSIATIETGQSRGSRDGVAIFRPAIDRRALVLGSERCCCSFLSCKCYFVYLSFLFSAEFLIKPVREPQNEIAIRSRASRSERAPSARRSPFQRRP